jgi:uncharacterized membrane protein YvlD (DUF360 family)
MTRSLIRIGLSLAGNAIGLLVAATILDKMDVDGPAFVIAVVIFTVLTAVLEPFISKVTEERPALLQSASALIATFLALVITVLVSDGLSIDGTVTWLIATVLVWLVTMIAGVILVKLVVKDATSR